MVSLNFVALSCFCVFVFCVKADDVCTNIATVKLADTWDMTKENTTVYFCHQTIRKPVINCCKFKIEPAGEEKSKITSFYYDRSSEEAHTDSYVTKMNGNAGIYLDLLDTPNVTLYIGAVHEDKQCMIYFDCFSGGPWGGAEDSGAFVGMVCRDRHQCEDPKYQSLIKNNKHLFVGLPKLEKTDHEKCKKLGLM